MRLYLKDKKDKILFDAQLWVKSEMAYSYIELEVILNIKNYSHFLLKNIKKSEPIIADFTNLNHLRGWLWERCFSGTINDPSKINEISEKLKIIFEKVAKTHNLTLITDDISRQNK